MNSIHGNGPDDKSLDDELEELGRAYQHVSPVEPPELLDKAVLNSAHRAVEARAGWMDFGWVHGLTTAAVVVLALSVILTQRQPVELDQNGIAPETIGSTQVAPQSSTGLFREEKSLKKDVVAEDTRLDVELRQRKIPVKAMAPARLSETSADESMLVESPKLVVDMLETDADTGFADEPEAEQMKLSDGLELSDEEVELQAILELRRNGDDRWITELASFVERNPDYPLPDGLKR